MTPDQSTRREHALVEAFISDHKTVRIECPQCRRVNDLSVVELPPGQPTFPSECPCGASFGVQIVGFRAAHRKRVKLAASCTRRSHTSRIKTMCDVVDLSVMGMRFRTEFTKGLAVGEEVIIALVLDDEDRTRLELLATVKRIIPAIRHVEVAVEFRPLKAEQRDTLQRYIAS